MIWLNEKLNIITSILKEYVRQEEIELSKLLNNLSSGVENVDELSWYRIWDYFLKYNIVMEIDERFRKLSSLSKDKYIGKNCAFQLPVYYWICKTIIELNTLNIKVDDILKVLKKFM